MGKTNSKTLSQFSDKIACNKYEDELEIIKNDIVYNFRFVLEEKDKSSVIKIITSFILNNKFKIYEGYLDQVQDKEKLDNIYKNIISLIKNENLEIINQDNIEQFISLKMVIDKEVKYIKLFQKLADDKTKLAEFTKNYISLQKKYIQLKNEMKNSKKQKQVNNHPMEEDENDEGNNYYNYYNFFPNQNNNNINNNTMTNYEKRDENHILLEINSQIWCMLNLNKITYKENNTDLVLNLVAIGFSNGKIIIINLNSLYIHQELRASNTVYSFAQFKDDSEHLICSLSNGKVIIYKLKEKKFEQIQILEKPLEIKKGEINKVITLSDGNLAAADRGSITIWKPKIENNLKQFEFFKELETNDDTCQLNPEIFACAIYRSKLIKVYKNDGNEYPLLGNICEVESHGNNSNSMAKIDNNTFCSGGKCGYIYIITVFPLQIIQKMILTDGFSTISFLHNSDDGFIFTSFGKDIFQYKIVKDELNNFVKLEKFETIKDKDYGSPIITTEGKIFYSQTNDNQIFKTQFCLIKYKK